jgi:hypothetical protein
MLIKEKMMENYDIYKMYHDLSRTVPKVFINEPRLRNARMQMFRACCTLLHACQDVESCNTEDEKLYFEEIKTTYLKLGNFLLSKEEYKDILETEDESIAAS